MTVKRHSYEGDDNMIWVGGGIPERVAVSVISRSDIIYHIIRGFWRKCGKTVTSAYKSVALEEDLLLLIDSW